MPAAAATIRTWHRRLSYVVGLQLLAWTASGLLFTWDPIEDVRGETSLRPEAPPPAPALEDVVPVARAAAAAGVPAPAEARLAWRRGRWTWSLAPHGAEPGAEALVDALTGAPLPPMDADEAARLATARLAAPAPVSAVTTVARAEGEYRGKPVPAFRVDFDDGRGTRLYVVAATGETGAVRNDLWRRFDWFWMLHIMDYGEREDFGTPWLKAAALLGLSTALTGLVLAGLTLRRG